MNCIPTDTKRDHIREVMRRIGQKRKAVCKDPAAASTKTNANVRNNDNESRPVVCLATSLK